MVKQVFHKRLLALIAGAVVLVILAVPQTFCQGGGVGEPGNHNQRGMEYFKQGFHENTPKGRATEADRNYGLAVKEFKAAISGDSSYIEAHRNLARVYYVQKNFDGAAEEYRRLTELAPADLDAYVNLSLALIELKRLDEAIQTLENAKRVTSDPRVLDMLDTYLSKVRAHQAKEVR